MDEHLVICYIKAIDSVVFGNKGLCDLEVRHERGISIIDYIVSFKLKETIGEIKNCLRKCRGGQQVSDVRNDGRSVCGLVSPWIVLHCSLTS